MSLSVTTKQLWAGMLRNFLVCLDRRQILVDRRYVYGNLCEHLAEACVRWAH